MKIIVLGWYGTETLGDRAILYGLIEIFEKTFQEAFGKVEVSIGSMNPFFTERSLYEDREFISLCGPNTKVSLFDVTSKRVLDSQIVESDLVVMGGGPIMDLHDLGIIEYGFGLAKKNRIKTALLGCGVGPLLKKKFQKTALKLIKNSDLVILRDEIGRSNIAELEKSNNFSVNKNVIVTFDPAILPVRNFIDNYEKKKTNDNITINFREFPKGNFKNVNTENIDELLVNTLNKIAPHYAKVVLFPMHTFHIGGDDRAYLNELKFKSGISNIEVINKPLSLWELFEVIYNSKANIGMRYHSVVFQTLLNGNNLIFDYTEIKKGKISGFINLINGEEYYISRYINIQKISDDRQLNINSLLETSTFNIEDKIYDKCLYTFCENLKALF